MKLLWTIVRIVVAVAAVFVMATALAFVQGPSGTTVDTSGALIDVVAAVVLVAAVWSLWHDRARLA